MCKKMICLFCLVLGLGLTAGPAVAELVAYYPLNDASGDIAVDASGNGHDATAQNGSPTWANSQPGYGMALEWDGINPPTGWMNCGTWNPSEDTGQLTVALWAYWRGDMAEDGWQGLIGKRQGWTDDGSTMMWCIEIDRDSNVCQFFRGGSYPGGGRVLPVDEWTHVTAAFDGTTAIFYINGQATSGGGDFSLGPMTDAPIAFGCVGGEAWNCFYGILDEVRIYDHGLSPEEVQLAMQPGAGPKLASSPVPGDGASDVPRDAALSWKPGDYAASHDVYFGRSLTDVAAAERDNPLGVLARQDQTETSFDPDGLFEYGQSYYWRIDEVNAPPDSSIFKGDVWSFTAEPFAYPVANITATASSSDKATTGPENTINGSGLDSDDLHSMASDAMWLSSLTGAQPTWIQYEFDQPYKLQEMWVWNYNVEFEVVLGFGIKDVTIEYSLDGIEWTVLTDAEFAGGPSADGYAHNTVVDFEGVMAQYVRLTANSNWRELMAQYGLAEVRFYHVPVQARAPNPPSGGFNVPLDVVLDWREGREAVSHDVYLSTDEDAVADGTALVDNVTESRYAPAPLEFGKYYYWRIDEVNEAASPSTREGDVWDFSTVEYHVIDDFESYTDDSPDRVFQTWIDGFGYTEPQEVPGNGTSSTVGNLQAPFAERTIVNSGNQSMPVEYDNSFAPFYSEAERTWATPQDWTIGGADTFWVHFRGHPISFAEPSPGNITMSAAGADIYETTDEFRFAYKRLTGDGSITVRVESIENTHEWAKAGVMIRAGLDTLAQQVHMIATPSNRVEFMYRPVIGATTSAVATDADTTPLPHWVRITRQGTTITGEHSADGVSWQQITATDGTPSTIDITMIGDIYIGLALTSHVSNVPAVAEFSNVQTSGGVSGQWQVADIGVDHGGNEPDQLYVAVQDSAGRTGVVAHPDPDAVLASQWQQWAIPLSEFTSAGVNMASVTKLIVGVGDRDNPQADGAGKLYIDDIRFGRALPVELANGGFEDGVLEPWWLYDNIGGGATAEVVSDDVVEGDFSLHIVVPSVGQNYWDVGLGGGGLVFRAGKKYTLSAFLKCKEGTLQATLNVELGVDPWTKYGVETITMTDEWAEYSVTTSVFTQDVSPGNVTFHIGYAAGEIWVDGVRFYEGDYVPPDVGN